MEWARKLTADDIKVLKGEAPYSEKVPDVDEGFTAGRREGPARSAEAIFKVIQRPPGEGPARNGPSATWSARPRPRTSSSLQQLAGHLQAGQFITKFRKIFTRDEMNDDLDHRAGPPRCSTRMARSTRRSCRRRRREIYCRLRSVAQPQAAPNRVFALCIPTPLSHIMNLSVSRPSSTQPMDRLGGLDSWRIPRVSSKHVPVAKPTSQSRVPASSARKSSAQVQIPLRSRRPQRQKQETGAAAKSKAPVEEDEILDTEEDAAPAKPKVARRQRKRKPGGGNTKVLIGVGLAVVGVIVLGVAALLHLHGRGRYHQKAGCKSKVPCNDYPNRSTW